MEAMGGKKTVAVIGAGFAGIVAAKSMLEVGLSPVVFEKAPWVGGLWNPNSNMCWESLKTNVSRYSCSFSDFPWDSEQLPLFPSQSQMFDYLQAYVKKFIPPQHFSLGSEVTSVSRTGDGRWDVYWSFEEETQCEEYDFVVFASGFLSSPYVPSIPGLETFPGELIHSLEYRNPEGFRGKRVVVVGAAASASELSGEIAGYASQVVNTVRRPLWMIPRFIPVDPESPATPFLPLDLALFRYSSEKQTGSLEEIYRAKNEAFRKLFGDQGDFNPIQEQYSEPPYFGISDVYREHVRSKRIKVIKGSVQEVRGRELILGDNTVIADIDCLVFATGFQTSIPFLSPEVLEELSFDPSDRFFPLLLHKSTFHPSLPGCAFVGVHKGNFMPLMELQARWAAAIFAGVLPPIPDSVQLEGIDDERKERCQVPRPLFPHGDYVSFTLSLAAELKVLPSEDFRNKHDIIIAAHFRSGSPAAETAVTMLEKECQELMEGKMVPNAVFNSLGGSWILSKKIDNRMDTSRSGTVEGTATFTTMGPHEYLYSETGELSLAGGQHFKADRKYVYLYDPNANRIDVFFEKEGLRDYLFYWLQFLTRGSSLAVESQGLKDELSSKISEGWRAVGQQHFSNEDVSYPTYSFEFQGTTLAKMEISYSVVGPQNNYTSIANYVRA